MPEGHPSECIFWHSISLASLDSYFNYTYTLRSSPSAVGSSALFFDFAGVAQLVEHLICNQDVAGSSPIVSSTILKGRCVVRFVEEFPSGQREQTVNLPSLDYGGSNPPSSTICGSSSVGRASAFQAECREFESRLPLQTGPPIRGST